MGGVFIKMGLFMKESGKQTKDMEKECSLGQMAMCIMECGKMILSMERDFLQPLMEIK